MDDRRLVGIDLGVTSAHTVRVLRTDGTTVCRPKADPTIQRLGQVERAALAGTPPGTRLEVVIEPTGPAWLPIAVFFTTRGHTVDRVRSATAHDLRRFLSRQAQSNGIDADTLARLPLVDPAGLRPLQLQDAPRAALDRRVRATDRLTRQAPPTSAVARTWSASCCPAARWSVSSARPTWPCWNTTGTAGAAARRPRPSDAASPGRLPRPPGRRTGRPVACRRPRRAGAVRRPPRRRLRRAGRRGSTAARHPGRAGAPRPPPEACRRRVDPAGLARSLPGLAEIGSPALVATHRAAGRLGAGSVIPPRLLRR
jgi:Transposase